MYYIRANGSKNWNGCGSEHPLCQYPAPITYVDGAQLANVAAVAVLSIDPCISCVER